MTCIDRSILANIRDCKAKNGYLGGAGCTNACEFRDSCRIPRTSFLVHTRNFKAEYEKSIVDSGIYISQYIISESNAEEYINDFTGVSG